MARVVAGLVLVADNLFKGEAGEEAERLRDPTHVRNYSDEEWRAMFDDAGLEVEDFELEDKRIDFEAWLDRAGTAGRGPRPGSRAARRPHRGRANSGSGDAIYKARKR